MWKKHEKTVAQIILRWHCQRGVAVIPGTLHKNRMKENLGAFDFVLTDREMEAVSAMNIGRSEIIDHHCFCTARQLNSIKIHL